MKLQFILIILSVITVHNAFGHSVYFEPNESGQLIIRFGEFGDDYEESPGFLDSLDCVYIWKTNVEGDVQALRSSKKRQGFDIDADDTYSVCAQSGFVIMTRGSSPSRKPYFYARWISDFSQKAQPKLNLDLVPTGEPGVVRAFFRNKPLGGVVATLYTPDANDQELESDGEGFIRFETKPKEVGLYMLKIGRYREALPGFDRGTEHLLSSHNCSITWVQR
jgi:hypothetical protein